MFVCSKHRDCKQSTRKRASRRDIKRATVSENPLSAVTDKSRRISKNRRPRRNCRLVRDSGPAFRYPDGGIVDRYFVFLPILFSIIVAAETFRLNSDGVCSQPPITFGGLAGRSRRRSTLKRERFYRRGHWRKSNKTVDDSFQTPEGKNEMSKKESITCDTVSSTR